jgi:Mlc titration factor MtfA (ptsG expression regulator)
MAPILLLLLVVAITVAFALYKKPLKKVDMPAVSKSLLEEHVAFYRSLEDAEKRRFEDKINEFLGYVRIQGVRTSVDDLDRLLVASSAVIPIFGFPEWKYYNLRDVLLYEDSFNADNFATRGEGRDVLGMVGNGAMQMEMILSKPSLHEGFGHSSGKENAGIHEFVHLLDKEDGDVDGVPEALLDKQYTIPWLQLMTKSIDAMNAGKSDINIYGAKNRAEFFAVAAEYFFSRPDLFKQKHPELYERMTQIFRQHPPAVSPEHHSAAGL